MDHSRLRGRRTSPARENRGGRHEFSMEGRWRTPKEYGQVVYHHESRRFGLVMEVLAPSGRKVGIFFPDKMHVENRYSTAFIESGYTVPVGAQVYGLRDGCQGIWWLDSREDKQYYLMTSGLSTTQPTLLITRDPSD